MRRSRPRAGSSSTCSPPIRRRSPAASPRSTPTASRGSRITRPHTAFRCSRGCWRVSNATSTPRCRAATTRCSSAWSRGAPCRSGVPCSTIAAATPVSRADDRHRAARRPMRRPARRRGGAARHRAAQRLVRGNARRRARPRAVLPRRGGGRRGGRGGRGGLVDAARCRYGLGRHPARRGGGGPPAWDRPASHRGGPQPHRGAAGARRSPRAPAAPAAPAARAARGRRGGRRRPPVRRSLGGRGDGEPGAAPPPARGGGPLDRRLRPAGAAGRGARRPAALAPRHGGGVGGGARPRHERLDAPRRRLGAGAVMRTVDRIAIRAGPDRVFALAADVERWPAILAHYRWVRMLERRTGGALVEMAAWRPFGPLRYPAWWVSEMAVAPAEGAIRYRHVRGITSGMDVLWQIEPGPEGTRVTVTHQWAGPGWPLVGPLAARLVIGPVFVHGIAARTLAGIRRAAEAGGTA